MAVKPLSKLTKREKVIEFCRRYEIDCNNRKSTVIVLASTHNLWFDVFNSWEETELFLINAKLDKDIHNKEYPWSV